MSVAENLNAISSKLDRATLIAVSKKQPIERVQEALDAGHRVFGENIVQDAQKTWAYSGLKETYPDLELHLIGSLQTNKVKDAVALFDVFHCVDRPKLVDVLVKEMKTQDKKVGCFIQINTGEEDQKSGVLPCDLGALLTHCHEEGLDILGLMCIPPVDEPSALHFAFLKKLAFRYDLPCLSMGMSSDFEKAFALGATHIRVGSEIFGARP